MQVTELRIAGFKSFVDPQVVAIEPGLTGIVGPNGCGKSNLLEALRWAMGANSARAMRGDEMDDLIFNGTTERAPRETAEVTLVLDNSDRTAPAEFNGSDTLEIVRKLKRGAGTSYKLNGRTVRGKDIHLLFADASTGANSPALVRQGQISELINAKPQNRRRILEEAAGIAGLNARRHESELKLDAAEANLARLTETAIEVERQLTSLKRQAAKARRYRRLSEEIQALEALLAHLRWVETRNALDEARARVAVSDADVERLTREDASAERKRIEAGEGLDPLREAESVAAAKLGQARIALARLEAERDAAVDTEIRLKAEAERIRGDLLREETARETAEKALAHARQELDALPAQDADADAGREAEARAQLETARAHLLATEGAADALQIELADLRARRRAAEESAASQTRRLAQLHSELKRAEAELAGFTESATLLSRVAAAREAEAQAELALHDAERGAEAAEDDLSAAREAETSAHGPFTSADSAVRSLLAEIEGLRRLLRKADGPAVSPVIERIRTDDGFERAVAAALGDEIEASIDPRAAMYWAGALASDLALPDGAEPLSNFVSAPQELAARLAQCGLVAATDGERLRRALKPGQRLVSREGHLWRWDGFVRTPDAPVSAAARLEQQARLEAAEIDLATFRDQLALAEAEHIEARDARHAAEHTLRELRQRVAPAQRTLLETRRALNEAESENDRTNLRRQSAEAAAARTQADLAAINEALALIAPQDSTTREEADLDMRFHSARDEVVIARAAEVEARGLLTDFTRGRDQAMAREAGLKRDVAAHSAQLEAAAMRLEDLASRRSKIAQEALLAAERPAELRDSIAELLLRVDALETERKSAADALALRQTALREAETAARAATAAASEAREGLAGWRAKFEMAETRLAESIALAESQFQRVPEGLLALAEAGLDGEALGEFSARDIDQRLDGVRRDRDSLGGVNMNAEEEAAETEARLGASAAEREDLSSAIAKLREGIASLNAEGRDRLSVAFDIVNAHFKALFAALFVGGVAELRLVEADDPLKAGLEIFAEPAGKKLNTLALMSGGEQALTATALIFAVFLSRPAPICVLDEVDAPLDDANVERFCNLLNEMRRRTNTRFIIITHNAVTMSRMDRLFGVTMREKGVSKLVSVDLEAAEQLVAAQ